MRMFLVLICSLALASAALGAEEGKGKKKEQPKKKAAHTGQVSQPAGKATGKRTTVGKPTGAGKPVTTGKPAGVGKSTGAGKPTTVGNAGFEKAQHHQNKKPTTVGKSTTVVGPTGKKFKAQHFNLPNKVNPAIASTKFQVNRRIEGSQNWQGSNYTVFRNYRSQWHDRDWWRHRYSRVGLFGGGWYYWNSGFWYPAWGYDRAYSYYPYDGPIYGYNNLPPDQVIGNVQAALQQQGYYHGEVDGLLGPQTRAAVADYQRDHRLYITSAIDRPTLASLGMA